MQFSFRNRFETSTPQRQSEVDFVAGFTVSNRERAASDGRALLAAVNAVLGIYTLIVAVPVATIFTSSVFMNVSTTAAASIVAGNELTAVPPAEDCGSSSSSSFSFGFSRSRPDSAIRTCPALRL